jgi:hypothetical protein
MSSKILSQLNEIKSIPVITLEVIMNKMQDEAILVLCLISILPFMQPIPLPGISSILGLIVLLQGISLMLWKKPILTKKMKEVEISRERFDQIYRIAEKFTRFTDKISVFQHPWVNSRASHIICGLAIVLSAAFLSLPLPIPMSNFVPALGIALICLGLLEEDLILTLLGLLITTAILWMAVMSYQLIIEQIQNYF